MGVPWYQKRIGAGKPSLSEREGARQRGRVLTAHSNSTLRESNWILKESAPVLRKSNWILEESDPVL